jgi:HSP20 family molecular chaperone IbpA
MLKNASNVVKKFNAPVTKIADHYMQNVQKSLDRRFDLMDSLFNGVGSWTLADDVFGMLTENAPPYDVHLIDGTYRIDVALAGFSKEQISIKVLEDKVLQIIAENKEVDEEETVKPDSKVKALHKKLSFTKKEVRFSISKNSDIHDVTFENGLLTVNVTPPNKKVEPIPKERLVKIE